MRRITVSRNCHRHGFVGVIVLVAMAAAVLIATVSLQRTTQQSQMRQSQATPQTALLIESAVSLANAQLQSDPAYQGETWNISGESGVLDRPAEIVIAVRPHDYEQLRNVEIQVKLGDKLPRVSRESLKLTLPLPQAEQDK